MESISKILEKLKEENDTGFEGGLLDYTIIKMSYHSNKIEGSTLTEDQTTFMYEHGALVNDGSIVKVNDITEMENHFLLFDKMLKTIDEPLNEDLIKMYHKVLKSNTKDEQIGFNIGGYKKKPNRVGNIITSDPWDVQSDIENLLIAYNYNNDKTPKKLKDILEFHKRFEDIHPFQDGNGRIGRMIMFRECLTNNITPFIVKEETKNEYYRGLREYYKNPAIMLDYCKNEQEDYQKESDSFF